jgi:hypothetical protein
MKTTAIALACTLALAAGGALAAGSADDGSMSHKAGSAVDKAKNAIRGAGEKIGEKLHVDKRQQSASEDPSRDNNAKAMGASGSHKQHRASDSASRSDEPRTTREERMDSAYENWKSQHAQQSR